MINKRKIFNDPVYGFITIPSDIIFDLIQHPYVQRLRRISQLGLTHLTYPGALHTRFHHALGALHLMSLTLEQLKQKGTKISDEETEAAHIAILLHDLGHGPFSHALEHNLLDTNHEFISLALMESLNEQFDGRLDLAIRIFKDEYPKRFLHQLISGQLDMDRMDYLNRDSFYSGVMEGKIGYDRIIKMLRVVDDQLVVEEKGIYSIEKFLVARKIMYWQVYLHKTVLASELMLVAAIRRARELAMNGQDVSLTRPLWEVMSLSWSNVDDRPALLKAFVKLDDHDVMILLKNAGDHGDETLQFLASGLINRQLFSVSLSKEPFADVDSKELAHAVVQNYRLPMEVAERLIWQGIEHTETYDKRQGEILLFMKSGQVEPLSALIDYGPFSSHVSMHYLCHPKLPVSK